MDMKHRPSQPVQPTLCQSRRRPSRMASGSRMIPATRKLKKFSVTVSYLCSTRLAMITKME